MPAPLTSNLVFSCYEQDPWQLADGTTGALLGSVTGTPIDPFPPGCFGMGRFADNRIWIAPETYFVTLDNDLTNPDGGAANTPATDLLFSGGCSTTHLYKISTVLTVPKMLEVDPVTWTTTRSWTLLSNYGFPNIAADSGRTVAFFSNSSAAGPVRKLDLGSGVESVFLSNTYVGGLLMLPDDSLVVGWIDGVKRYDLSGTLLNTYPANAYGGQGNLALGITTRNSIWIQSPATGAGRCHMYEVEIDTEAVLVDFEMPEDGTSYNSPYAVIQTTSSPSGTIEVVKVTDPPSDPQVFSFTTTNLTPATFTLMDGDTQTFSNVTIGSGYGVSEDVIANWGTEYVVSNGSPIDNISVTDGETVTVTVTNTFAGECIETTYGIRVLRRAPHLSTEQLLRMHHRFTLDLEAGLGLRGDASLPGVIYLRWSDDGGHQWSGYYSMSAGSLGAYSKRLFRNRLGKSRDRIYEVSSIDDAWWNIIAAYLETELSSR